MMGKILKVDIQNPEASKIEEIVERLISRQVAILPTDTVYGLSCVTYFMEPVERIRRIKEWDEIRPMLILIENLLIADWMGLELSDKIKKLQSEIEPTPLTHILPTICGYHLPVKYEGGVAVRKVQNKFMGQILRELKSPVFSTSVNIKNDAPLTDIEEIKNRFIDDVDFIVDGGDLDYDLPSTIVDFSGTKPVITREGPGLEKIKETIKEIF